MSRDKHPKTRAVPVLAKEPKATEARSFHNDRPSWRIGRMDLFDPFGWHTVDADRLQYIREKLGQFESRTWAEILIHAKKQNHSISVDDLCKEARDRLDSLFQGNIDVDELVSLRLSGKERVWGILSEGVLSLLWWDPEHAVCPLHAKD